MNKKIESIITNCENYSEIQAEYENSLKIYKGLDDEQSCVLLINTLDKVLAKKSLETYKHSIHMVNIADRFAKELNFTKEETERLKLIARFHDLGKLIIKEEVLNKNGKLTQDEWADMMKHSEYSCDIIQNSTTFGYLATEILHHHERYDGKGYPCGLKGEEIPLLSRVIALVDTYEVLINGRVYKPAISNKEAIKEIKRCSGTQFDPKIAKAFIKAFKNEEKIDDNNDIEKE